MMTRCTRALRLAPAALLLFLAACGIDGKPKPPAPKAPAAVTVTGEARVGVTADL